jgi:hypothetical protein
MSGSGSGRLGPGRGSGAPHLRLEQLPDLACDRCEDRAEREANEGGRRERYARPNDDPYRHWRSATLSA